MRKICHAIILVLAASVILAPGCQKKEAKKAPEKTGTPLVEFDGGYLSVEDFRPVIEQMKLQMRPEQRAQFDDPANIKNLLNMISEEMVIAAKAREAGLDQKPGVKGFMSIYENKALMYAYIFNVVMPDIEKRQIPDEELKQFYDENIALYDQSQVKARHILVDTEEEAKAIYKQVGKNPAAFPEVAKAKSKDTSNAASGGDLGWFGKGRMVKPFEDVAFAMEKGTVSEPVQTRFGWHVILVEDKTETGLQPFETVKEDVRTRLIEKNKNEMVRKTVTDLKDSNHLKVYEENIAKVAAEAAPAAPAPGQPGNTPPPPPPQPQQAQPSQQQ